MLSWALTFFVLASVAGVLGFTGIASASAGIAKILFVVFIVLFVLSFFLGRQARLMTCLIGVFKNVSPVYRGTEPGVFAS